jgi:hypothetical protein
MEILLFSMQNLSNRIVSTLDGSMGEWYPILFNVIGVISIVLQFLIFQMKKQRGIVMVGLFSDIGWLLYFVLQGDLISSTANIIGLMSKTIVLLRGKFRWTESPLWNVFFVLFSLVFSLLTFKTIIDIFAFIACISSVLAFFMKKENNIRKVALISFIAYVCNSVSKLYIVALIADITALISIISSLIRYREQDKKDNCLEAGSEKVVKEEDA